MKYIINILFILTVCLFLGMQVIGQDLEIKHCYIILDLEFLDTGKTSNITVSSNKCFQDLWFEQKAFELARKTNFQPSYKRDNVKFLRRKLKYVFKIDKVNKNDTLYNSQKDRIIVEEPIVIVSKPKAAYPRSGGGTVCFRGTVRLKVAFLNNSKIGEVKIIKGLPYGANENAIQAAKNMKFIPMKRNGIPISVTKTVVFSFRPF